MSNLKLRVITGIFLAVLLLGALYLGGLYFAIVFSLIGGLVLYEWLEISNKRSDLISFILSFFCYFVSLYTIFFEQSSIFFLGSFFVGLLIYGVLSKNYWTCFGFLYATIPTLCIIRLRSEDSMGFFYTSLLFLIVWISDIGAYFVGRSIGGPKLAPIISPNKTWSGAIGGWFFSLIASLLFSWLIFDHLNFKILLISVLLSMFSQIGDLGESWIKRHFKVKNSGSFLPGHGGFMDRFDSFFLAAVFLYFVKHTC